MYSRAARAIWVAIRRPRRDDAITGPANTTIIGPKSHYGRCIDTGRHLSRSSSIWEERCWGEANVAASRAGTLMAGRFPVLLYWVIQISSILGSGVRLKCWVGVTERTSGTYGGKPDLVTSWDVQVRCDLLWDGIGCSHRFETPKGKDGEKGDVEHGDY